MTPPYNTTFPSFPFRSNPFKHRPHFMMIQKFQPTSAKHTKVHYEVYRHRNSTDEQFHAIADTYARVMKEDKALCDRAQANLNAGVFINGELHPRWEKGMCRLTTLP